LRVGDVVTSIDGKATDDYTLTDSADRIRGTVGTEVVLSVRSPGDSASREVRVTRAPLTLEPVESSLRNGVEYVKIRGLPDGVANLVRVTLAESARQGATGWVLDLRGNLTGSIDEGANLASLFVGEQPVGIRVDRQRRTAEIHGTASALPVQLPTVVLVDQETGGGAELFAAALRDYQMATVTGKTTAGRIDMARTAELSNGGALQITMQHVLTPKGAWLGKGGLAPDEEVDLRVEDWSVGRDPQLERALSQARALGSQSS
jgi:carboxyl-terminal processing protease